MTVGLGSQKELNVAAFNLIKILLPFCRLKVTHHIMRGNAIASDRFSWWRFAHITQ